MSSNIFSIKSGSDNTQTPPAVTTTTTAPVHGKKDTYRQHGFRLAGRSEGGIQSFIPDLHSVLMGLKKEQENDKDLQLSLELELKNKKANKEKDKDIEENNLRAQTEKQKSLETELADKKQEKTDLKASAYKRNRGAWITLIISSVLLVPFTIYFFIFYSSVGYSAFFKQFNMNDLDTDGNFNLSMAIFDPHAIPDAMSQGFTAAFFILLMPIIFLAFGFILNRWEQEKGWFKWVKIPTIIIVAFVFDALLAYEICEKIYNIIIITRLEEMPEYSFSLAAKDPRFWIIICLGFVSYLIWGITFSYFIKSLDQLDLNKILLEQVDNDIKQLNKKIEEVKAKLTEIANKIASLKHDIEKINNQLNGSTTRYDISRIKLELNNFHSGWQQYMAAINKSDEEKNNIAEAFNNVISGLTENS